MYKPSDDESDVLKSKRVSKEKIKYKHMSHWLNDDDIDDINFSKEEE